MTNKDNKEYINARFESLILQYAMFAALILIGPLGILYAFIGVFSSAQFVATGVVKIIFVIACFAWLGVAVTVFFLRKYWVFIITISNTDVKFIGFMRKITANWNQIITMEIKSTGMLFGGKMVEVKTSNGQFYFPLTMKERGNEYPKLDLLGEQWIASDDSKKPITVENCLLYTEIKKNLKNFHA